MPRVSDEFLQKIADGRAGSRCDCPAYWQRRDEARELIAARVIVDGRRANCACHKQPCPCMFCEQLRKYDEATK